jgi:ABC-2 type transport system ATP-binding protein
LKTNTDTINTLLIDGDYSQLSRVLLDLSYETQLEKSLEDQIYSFRKSYLNETPRELLKQEAEALIQHFNEAHIVIHETNHTQTPVCIATDISKQYFKGSNAFKLNNLSLDIKFGEITGIVGENGNGKTTLLRILAGEISSDTGKIEYPALNADDENWYKSKQNFVFIPQRIPRWHGKLIDNLHFFSSIHGIKAELNERQINYILLRLGLEKYKNYKWSELSSGYRLRFELAKAIMWRPKLLLLDEPLANLDINAQQLFLKDLQLFTKSLSHPLSVVLSSQQLHEVESISDNIIFIRQGQTIYNGSQQAFANEREYNTFEISGNLNKEIISNALYSNSCKIDVFGNVHVITVNKSVTKEYFLEQLIKHHVELDYFRDISASTRKLFHRDI